MESLYKKNELKLHDFLFVFVLMLMVKKRQWGAVLLYILALRRMKEMK